MRTADRARRDGIRPLADPGSSRARAWRGLTESITKQALSGIDRRTPVIVADDVAEWRVRTADHKKVSDAWNDMPCMAPPWEQAWIEYPSFSNNERRAIFIRDLTPLFSIANPEIRAELEMDGKGIPSFLDDAVNDAKANGYGDDQIGWVLYLVILIEAERKVHGPVGLLALVLDTAGRPIGNRWMWTGRPESEDEMRRRGVEPAEWLLAAADGAFWTYALLNMRNVTTEEVRPPVQRRHRKRGNLPPVRYHVLRLALPGGRTTGLDGRSPADSGIHPGVHVVRGHPAHYGDCCPGAHPPNKLLFGKLTGVYWVPAHIRGSADEGEVLTDFEATIRDESAG